MIERGGIISISSSFVFVYGIAGVTGNFCQEAPRTNSATGYSYTQLHFLHLQASLGGEVVRRRGSIWLEVEAWGFRDATGHDRLAAGNFQDMEYAHEMYDVR